MKIGATSLRTASGHGCIRSRGQTRPHLSTACSSARQVQLLALAGLAIGARTLPAQVSPAQVPTVEVPATVTMGSATRLAALRRIGHSTPATAFGRITRLVADPAGGILVVDGAASGRPLLRFGANGAPLSTMGRFGEGPGEFGRGISALIASDGQVVVYEGRVSRLTIWDQAGRLVRTLPVVGLGGRGRVGGIRVGPNGTVVVAELVQPSNLGMGQDRWTHLPTRFAIVDLTSGAVAKLPWQEPIPPALPASPFGRRIFREPLVSGELVEVSSERLSLHLFGATGAIRNIRAQVNPPSVTREERIEEERYRDYLEENEQPIFRPPRWDIPNSKQVVTDLVTDHRGRIWVRLATEAFAAREQIRAKQSDGTELSSRMRDRQLWAAFLPTGKYLGAVLFPDTIEEVVFSGGYAWGMERDDDDLQYLVQFKLPW